MRVDQGPLERGGEDERRARETARRLLGRDDPASARGERHPRLGARPRFEDDDSDDASDATGDSDGEKSGRTEGFRRPDRAKGPERSDRDERPDRAKRPERVERVDRPVPVWRRPERRRRDEAAKAKKVANEVTDVADATDVSEGVDRPRTGRIRGVVRKVDTWSVFKVSLVFYAAMYCIVLVAGVVLWLAATATGLRHNVESFIADLIASGKFHFVGTELLRAAAVAGVVLVVLGTAANVLLVVLYNLISDMVGGLDLVIEERPARRRPRSRRREPGPEPVNEPVEEVDEVEVFKPRPSEASQ